ncbi:hypothetical protein AT251_24785 [Enterovibrio nigricans]|nr:hypothetical protein AT251_24785 [Enterovibrio nigricans]
MLKNRTTFRLPCLPTELSNKANAMKSAAGAAASKRLNNENTRRDSLQKKAQSLNEKAEQVKTQTFNVTTMEAKGGRLFSILNGKLPFGTESPVTMFMKPNQRMHLQGSNGSGKSTLLKVLKGEISLLGGELHLNMPIFYLDQHVSLLNNVIPMLECLRHFCPHMKEMDARTLLAGIGFRRDSVFRQVGALSGGEKMKLAILIISIKTKCLCSCSMSLIITSIYHQKSYLLRHSNTIRER